MHLLVCATSNKFRFLRGAAFAGILTAKNLMGANFDQHGALAKGSW